MFKIGEFSKIAQVSGHLLRYYNEIGLFTPAKIDQWTGYRYYSAQQLPRLNRILALKELGLSLEQIRRMLDEAISAEEIRGMFALRKAQIEQSIQTDIANLHQIESRLRRIEKGDMSNDYEITVKKIPAQQFLAVRSIYRSFDEARQMIDEMQRSLPKSIARNTLGHLTALIHNEMFGDDEIDLEMGFVTTQQFDGTIQLSNGRALSMRTLPAVALMATSMRVGSPATAHSCRATLATWVESNGYEFNGNGRELFIVPPKPGREHETVMEIQYPIIARHKQTNAQLTDNIK